MSSRLAHNMLHSALAGLSVMLGGFLSNVLVARMLGVEATGIVAFATWAITVGVMLADLGHPGSLARYLPDLLSRGLNEQAQSLVRRLAGISIGAAAAILSAFLAYAWWCWIAGKAHGLDGGNFRLRPEFWILVGAACFAQTLAALVNGYLKGMQQFATMARLAAASALMQLAATYAGGLMYGHLGAIAGATAGSIAPLFFLPRMLTSGAPLPSDLTHRVRRFAIESWAGYLVTAFAWARMEIFFLEMSWGSHSVALFAVSVTLANLATQGPLLLTGGLLPHLSRQSALRTGRKPQETYAMALRVLAFLIFPACLGAAAIAPSLVPAIYGRDFAGAAPSTAILLCGAAVTASSSVALTYMLAMERTRFAFVTGSMAALAVAAVGVTLIPAYGLMAAATARAAIQALVSLATVCYLWRALDCPTPVLSLLRLFVAAALCALVAWACVTTVPGVTGIAVAVPAGAIVYAAAVRLLRAMPQSEAEPLFNALAVLPWPIRVPATTTLRLIAA